VSAQSVAIVGGGIVGLAVARELLLRHPGTAVAVYEKESQLGVHQTGTNSGVVHAGIYYRRASLKAALCGRGRILLREFCTMHDLPYVECGKLVVAVDRDEEARLDALEVSARANRVPQLARLSSAAMQEVEPHALGIAALHSPSTAITDFVAIARQVAAEVLSHGGEILLGSKVSRIVPTSGRVDVTADLDIRRYDRVIVCAGTQVDRLARAAGGPSDPRIVPFRGEYLEVLPSKRELVRGLIYPVPDPRHPFLGVHFTRRVDGRLEVGPNAVPAWSRDNPARSAIRPSDVLDNLAWPGFWRLARDNWRTGLAEVRGSMLMAAYMRSASRYVPEITVADVRRTRAGLRAQAVDRDGSLVDDFRIDDINGVLALRNAPSPGATSSLAIAEYVVDRLR
jgi:L-2-hydroxyglutarate oxidase